MTYNEILLSGEINNIIINNRYIILGLTCKKYSPNESSNIVYASLRVYKDLYDSNKGLFLLAKSVYLKGYLNSYSDKNKTIHNYVTVTKIESYDFISANGPVIGEDYDGVMLWNGKRCESVPPTEEELAELEELLKPFKDGILVNNPFIVDINLSMKEDKKEIFKELILNYLLKQIMEKK